MNEEDDRTDDCGGMGRIDHMIGKDEIKEEENEMREELRMRKEE